MMDADKARFNACVTELPRLVVLMCWFHVLQNVWKHSQELKVHHIDSAAVFADLYDLLYASASEYTDLRDHAGTKWQGYVQDTPAHKSTNHITKMRLSNFRFNCWQAFRTPSGYVATSNPLEQYHKMLKVQCPGGPATPGELLRNLNAARIAFLNRDATFCYVSTASERLMSLYWLQYRRGCFAVHRLPAVRSVEADLYRVNHKPMELAAAEKKLVAQNVRSINACRMQIKGIPAGGWIVDTRSKACSCPYSRKHGLCCHIIAPCIQADVACPGVSMNTRRFVRQNHVHAAEDSDDTPSDHDTVIMDTAPAAGPAPAPAIEGAEHLYRFDYAITPPQASPAFSEASTISFASIEEVTEAQVSQIAEGALSRIMCVDQADDGSRRHVRSNQECKA
ncbi:unnamed protein product [Phytophthora fragariaefolia]|uniref:Unnamed protein product n=1 Tax=Phytophthora fragariaefolia TaxID=1490495 RepID=A0A9W6XN46_9STRA|nr:unnamed protein product [Phytophthora fragariaefolia]